METKDKLADWQGTIADCVTPAPTFDMTGPPLNPLQTTEDLQKYLHEYRQKIISEAYEWTNWALCEIKHWQERCTELEIEIESADAFVRFDDGEINIKERSKF